MAATAARTVRSRSTRTPRPRLRLDQAMAELERAGSEQTRQTYARHGAMEPMFGVSFATLKTLSKRIGVDHALALALWETGNFDACNLAVKVVDPAQLSAQELDCWAAAGSARMCGNYVAWIAAEGPHGRTCVARWLASADAMQRCSGWKLVGALATLDEALPGDWFAQRLVEIEAGIHRAPNAEREAMHQATIAIGCRDAALREAARAAAGRIGPVQIDHGQTACKTPDALASIAKAWAHAAAKGFDSPAAQERARESLRTRC